MGNTERTAEEKEGERERMERSALLAELTKSSD